MFLCHLPHLRAKLGLYFAEGMEFLTRPIALFRCQFAPCFEPALKERFLLRC